ncbi:sigma-70 family RNA polymerase sigma factor [Maridesulfovibrio zosterae]|uniref:sigma-70 family RNA polymerase sigma factor n=1 Tax=Maridesulfovibrio zosterae TaxID=82171 RepID=UPI0003F7BE36|nr:sigma-70 family RNA polymerase sigma factor [Maridesulfovibrio zosterae]
MNTYIKENFEYNDFNNVDVFFKENTKLIKCIVNKFLRSKYNSISSYDIDEVFQEIAFKIVKNKYIEKYSSEKSSLNTWIYIISRSVSIDYMRKRHCIYINVEDLDDYAAEDIEKVKLTIPDGLLSKRQSEVLQMIFWGDLKAVEVAQHLGITARTVRCIKHQALLKLRRHFGAARVRRIVS